MAQDDSGTKRGSPRDFLASATGRRQEPAGGRSRRRGAEPGDSSPSARSPDEARGASAFRLPSISPPKGGGAIQGIDAKFSTNPSTGTCSLTIPVATSPGRSEFRLGLALTYDSGAGSGPFGVGWQLGVPAINRRTERGMPRYLDGAEGVADSDTFVLSGAEELVVERSADGAIRERREPGWIVRRYRPRVESSFMRIERWTNVVTGEVHWRTTTGENTTSIFGRDPSARISDPDDSSRVHSWLLEQTDDDRGNVVRYVYKAEDGAGVDPSLASEAHRWNAAGGFTATAQRHLKRILYGNARPGEASSWCFEVVFDYGEHDPVAPSPEETRAWDVRRDPFSTYRQGFEVRTYRLCRRVLMFHRFEELGPAPVLVRSTDFDYDVRDHLTRLARVTHAGYLGASEDGYERQTLPPIDLEYSPRTVHEEVRTLERASLEGIEQSGVSGPLTQWVDLDGEGIAGVLVASERALHYKTNLGGGRLSPPALLRSLPAPTELASGTQAFVDVAGDGRLALVRYTPPLAGYFARTRDGGWAPFVPFRAVPNIDWADDKARFVDLDGDGHPDILVTEDEAFVWYRSRQREGFDPATIVSKPRNESDGPAVIFTDRTEAIVLADMTGDGLVDIVRVRSGEIVYWPNLGYGRFGRKVTMDRSPRFDGRDAFEASRVRVADIDGSGTSDILYLGRDGIPIYFNESGNGLSHATTLPLPVPEPGTSVSVVDLLGQGTACLVWSSALPAEHARRIAYVDLMGGTKPHLLTSFANNFGGETSITYRSSTEHYLRDKAEGRPWLTRLPFPVHVVETVTRSDRIAKTKLVTRLRYHHGFFDGVEREYRGFAHVEQWDAESFEGPTDTLTLPPVRLRTWFHTGAWLEHEGLERELAREWYGGDGTVLALARPPLPPGLTTKEQREAARALRGRMLRQEIYADDGTPQSGHPYSVSEQAYGVRRLQQARSDAHGIFFVHPREKIEHAYERNPDDPRTRQELALEVDDFGNVTRTVAVAYPRRQNGRRAPEQTRLFATIAERDVANVDERAVHRIGVPVESRTYELTGLPSGAILGFDDARLWVAEAKDIPFEAGAREPAVERRLIARERTTYYADDLGGPLPRGRVGARALPFETATQAFTPGLLAIAFDGRVDEATLVSEGGYRFEDGVWWARSSRLVYDPKAFFLAVEAVDCWGNRSSVRYDPYAILLVETRDALGNTVTCGTRDAAGESTFDGNDYRALAPWLVTDANLNRAACVFDALGMRVRVAMMGKDGANEGDTLDEPTTKVEYDLHRYATSGGRYPILVRSLARERHGRDARWIEAVSYVDGSARDVMKKVQAEPGPVPVRGPSRSLVRDEHGELATRFAARRWVGSGRTVFDNKGNVIKRYEPFFSDTDEYEQEQELVEWGVTAVRRYDPLGRLVRTDLPNGAIQRNEVDAWTHTTWDENDTVLESAWFVARGAPDPRGPEPADDPPRRAAWLAARHARTPTRSHADALGRTFATEEDAGDPRGPYRARVEFDIAGNLVAAVDARGVRIVGDQVFDMLGRRLVARRVDGGWSRSLTDAAGNLLRTWDARSHAIRMEYDALRRPTRVWVRAGAGPEALVSCVVYGEEHPEAHARNLRSRAYQTFDGAGVATNESYDFDGNLTETRRRLAVDRRRAPDWSSVLAGAVDPAHAETSAEALLESESFTRTTRFDALGRVISTVGPDGSETRPTFNEASLVAKLDVRLRGAAAWTTFLADVAYDARGQRIRVVHGNGVVTSYEYERDTFRLRQISSRRNDGTCLQALRYEYDPVGNIVEVLDGVSYGNANVSASGAYAYDPLYRLVRADGREHPGQQPSFEDVGGIDLAHPHDFERLRRYRESYAYDPVGNLTRVDHRSRTGSSPGWTRLYEYEPGTCRLVRTRSSVEDAPNGEERFTYDEHGNTTSMAHLPAMVWDHADRLVEASRGGGGRVYFTYDASGQRVRKVYEHSGLVEERIYLGGYEIYRKRAAGDDEISLERETLHVMDDRRRIAAVETKTVPDVAARIRFCVENHLGSTTMELGEHAEVISYEEYLPFGASAVRAVGRLLDASASRYRYTGKERDEETGLFYCGARYYASWLSRWISVDPAVESQDEGQRLDQPYVYVQNRPFVAVDPDGRVIWFLVAAIVVVATATAVSPANAPTSAEDARRAQPRISDGEFAFHTAVVGVSFAAGGGAGSGVLRATGSKVLAGVWGGGVSGVVLAPGDMFVHDAFRGEFRSGRDYAVATSYGWLFGAGTGLVLGAGSRALFGPYVPRAPLAGEPPPLSVVAGEEGGGAAPRTWQDFLPQAEQRLANAYETYGGRDVYAMAGRLRPGELPSKFYENTLPERLAGELAEAAELGVTPIRPGTTAFEALVEEGGQMKFVVTQEGELLVGPHTVAGTDTEIAHSVLSGGRPVVTAGQAQIAGSEGGYVGLEITAHSGHYRPLEPSLEFARRLFAQFGIVFP